MNSAERDPQCSKDDDQLLHDVLRFSLHDDLPREPPTCPPKECDNANDFAQIAQQICAFAKSLGGSPSQGAPCASINALEAAVHERAQEALAQLDTQRPQTPESDQINDETVAQPLFTNAHVSEVFDPTFRFCFEVPTKSISHFPPSRLNITRLVFCRNYQPGEKTSCAMGEGCKFVHADVDFRILQAHPIHVKYIWRHENLCTYQRLPAGETLVISAPHQRLSTEEVPSHLVLVTKGSLSRHEPNVVMSHCAHYHLNRMCNRGERCNFIHVVHVDPSSAEDFRRAPCCKSKQATAAAVSTNGPAGLDKADKGREATTVAATQESRADFRVSSGKGGPSPPSLNVHCESFFPASQFPAGGVALPPQPHASAFPTFHHSALASSNNNGSCAVPLAGSNNVWLGNHNPHSAHTFPLQFPLPAGAARKRPTQHGMLVFVPCDSEESSTVVSPAALNAVAGQVPSITLLPASTLELFKAAYPQHSNRFAWAQGGSLDAAMAVGMPDAGPMPWAVAGHPQPTPSHMMEPDVSFSFRDDVARRFVPRARGGGGGGPSTRSAVHR